MEDNSSLSKEFKEKLAEIEKEMDSYNLDLDKMNKDLSVSDSVKMYLQEIGMYPLLTPEEEKEYGKIIQFPENVKLLLVNDINNITTFTLNKELLFVSLVNSSTYNTIIDSILNLYSKINIHEGSTVEDLLKYKRISAALGRPLDSEELKKHFNIDNSHQPIKEVELLNDVKDFIEFKYAFDKFFKSNLRLVVSVAKKHYSNLDFLELISEGNIGLLRAMRKYNPSLGYKFSTYAVYWISQSMDRAITKYNSTVRLPDNYYHEIRKFKKEVEALEKQEERELNASEISEKLNIPIEKVYEYQNHMFEMISLNKPIGEDSDMSVIDMIAKDDDIDEVVFSNSLKDDISVLFQQLNERECKVIKMRFGIGREDGGTMTLPEISKELSVSVARVRQIEARAIMKMRRLGRSSSSGKSLKYYL